jgi:hypothetical protein
MTRMRKIKSTDFIFSGFMFSLSAVVLFIIKLSQPQIKSENDLAFISGKFNGYSFIKGNKGRRHYTFDLINYSNHFQIKADFLKYFKTEDFKLLKTEDSITLSVAKVDLNSLNLSNNDIFIFSVQDSTKKYLKSEETIKRYNSNGECYLFIFLFILGVIFILFGFRIKAK